MGAVAGDELPPEPFLLSVLARLGRDGAPQRCGLGQQAACVKQMLSLPQAPAQVTLKRGTLALASGEVRQGGRSGAPGAPAKVLS